MGNSNSPSGFSAIINGPLTNKDGTASPGALQMFRDWNTRLTNGLNLIGNFIGNLELTTGINGRSGDMGSILGNIDPGGLVTQNGVDFTQPYLNKSTDNITDGTGSPLAGGVTAYSSLVASSPAATNALVYSGTAWGPAQIEYGDLGGTPVLPSDSPATASNWVNSYTAATGVFTESQPAFTDISGMATAGQVPALSALSGQITTAQLPSAGITHTAPLAKLTTLGANGSLTFTNGILTAAVDPT